MSFRIKCPTCKNDVQWVDNPSRPFCSERCRIVDLGAWAAGDYRVPCCDVSPQEDSE